MIDPRYLIDYLSTEDVVADAVGDFTAGTATYIPIVGEIRDSAMEEHAAPRHCR